MVKIFINYRRTDSAWAAAPLFDFIRARLRQSRDSIFMDREALPLGKDFDAHIKTNLLGCDVVLVLIGPTWVSALKARQLEGDVDPQKDYVRLEIAMALSNGIDVVPVLLDGASMPNADDLPDDIKGLQKRHGTSLGQNNFEADATRLLNGIGVRTSLRNRRPGQLPAWLSWPALLTLASTLAVVLLQHVLDFDEGNPYPALIGISSLIGAILGAGGFGLAASRRAIGFIAGSVAGAIAIIGLLAIAGFVEPQSDPEHALLFTQLLRDVSALVAAVLGYLMGLPFRARVPQPRRPSK
jgi:hypothetical protein